MLSLRYKHLEMSHINHVIKEWSPEDRPREKFRDKGREAVTDSELLAILIGSGTKSRNALALGRDILNLTDGDLLRLGNLSVQELSKVSGIGEARAITIAAALELGRRRREAVNPKEKLKVGSSLDIDKYCRHLFQFLTHETFQVAYLNRANHIIIIEKISSGGLTSTIADPRIILKKALIHEATSIILMHNHPSGNLRPSESDLDLTRKLRKSAKEMDINVLDHVIFSDQNYFSFADNDLM